MDMQHIEFSDGSAASAALAEAFDRFAHALDDFDLSEIRAAASVASVPGWASPKRKPPPSFGRRYVWIRVVQRTVKASGRLHFPTTDTTSPNLHKITRAAPDGSGPLPLGRRPVMADNTMLSRQQAAERMGISLDVLDRLRSSGELAYVQHRKGSKVWIPEWAITEYFDRITRPARPVKSEPVVVLKTYRKRRAKKTA